MKIFKSISIIFLLFLVACKQVDYDPIPLAGLLGEKIDSTYSIARFKKQFVPTTGQFSAVKIQSSTDVIINGIVTSTDVEGNVYKYLVVQEEVPRGEAIKISIDVSGLSAIYPLGQRVAVKLNGLYIGKYAESPQVGVYYENVSRTPVRIEPGRIPKLISDQHVIAYGMPDPSAIVADTMTIAQIRAAGDTLFNRLVYIKNAYFTGRGADFGKPANINNPADRIFAPSTNGVGFPQSREIQDGTGSIFISTSEYASFATKPLPASSIKGDITAIVGWYNDRATFDPTRIYHQLTLRTLSDLGKGFEAYHTQQK